MSNNNPTYYGYGKDIKMKVNTAGEIDLAISRTGDLDLVGGDGSDTYLIRAENAAQQIKLRVITPLNSLKDENGNTLSVGSELLKSIGSKHSELTFMYLRSSIQTSLNDLNFIQSINSINFVVDRAKAPSSLKIQLSYTLKDDTAIYFVEFNIGDLNP